MRRLNGLVASLLQLGLMRTVTAGLAVGLLGTALAAQSSVPREDGARLFRTWCASCHGVTAQGEGALAPMMKRTVPDLTAIAARNGGIFPAARVRRIIDGRDVDAHGSPEMPVWGTTFRTKDGDGDAAARARIDALVAYLETIQKRNAH